LPGEAIIDSYSGDCFAKEWLAVTYSGEFLKSGVGEAVSMPACAIYGLERQRLTYIHLASASMPVQTGKPFHF
jgi:hypothetical protein